MYEFRAMFYSTKFLGGSTGCLFYLFSFFLFSFYRFSFDKFIFEKIGVHHLFPTPDSGLMLLALTEGMKAVPFSAALETVQFTIS